MTDKNEKRPARKRAAESYPRIEVASRGDLRAWLVAHHARSNGVWVVTHKISAGGRVAWNDVVEEALCFGWIDSLPRKVDDNRSMLLLTPRKPQSKWSAKNKRHVLELERRNLMHAAGRAVVEAARRSGMWNALDAVASLTVPDDLASALAAREHARENWEAFPPSTRRGILEWIDSAKRPATRGARVAETAQLASEKIRANQWSPPGRKTTK